MRLELFRLSLIHLTSYICFRFVGAKKTPAQPQQCNTTKQPAHTETNPTAHQKSTVAQAVMPAVAIRS